jgi:hypothetical protein
MPEPRLSLLPVVTEELGTEPGVYHYSAWQNISVGVWVGQATLPAVVNLFSVGGQMNRRYRTGHSSVVFIADMAPAPTPEAGDQLKRVFGAGSQLACMGIVLEGAGFWASGLRSMLANMHRTSGGNARMRIHTSIDSVADWLPAEHARLTGVRVDAQALRRALQELRAHGIARASATR